MRDELRGRALPGRVLSLLMEERGEGDPARSPIRLTVRRSAGIRMSTAGAERQERAASRPDDVRRQWDEISGCRGRRSGEGTEEADRRPWILYEQVPVEA